MKHIFVFILVLMSVPAIYSQQVIGGGVITNKPKSENKLDIVNIQCLYEYKQATKIGSESVLVTDSMMLELGKDYSLYYDWRSAYRDSIRNNHLPKTENIKSISVIKDKAAFESLTSSGMGEWIEVNPERETTKLYKDYKNSEVITTDKGGRNLFKCTEKIAHPWEISEDTQIVLGYECQKALTTFRGRDYTVWFAPDIPVNDGPWKFFGLPGLILQVVDSENIFSFKALGIEKLQTDKDITMVEADYISCNSKQLEEMRQKRLSSIQLWNVDGGNVTISEKNNPIVYIPIEKK